MAVTAYPGNKLTGLSTDTKPTWVIVGSTFTETDTGDQFGWDGSAWVKTGPEFPIANAATTADWLASDANGAFTIVNNSSNVLTLANASTDAGSGITLDVNSGTDKIVMVSGTGITLTGGKVVGGGNYSELIMPEGTNELELISNHGAASSELILTGGSMSLTASTIVEIQSVTGGEVTLGGSIGAPYLDLHTGADATTPVLEFANGCEPQFDTFTTGVGSALLGANSPAVTNTAPYQWIKAVLHDGSDVFFPVWK